MIPSIETWPIRSGLVSPVLTLGTERALLLTNATGCMAFALATRFHWPVVFTPMVFLFLHMCSNLISKADPYMIRTFRRAQRYRGYYPPISGMRAQYEREFSSFNQHFLNI